MCENVNKVSGVSGVRPGTLGPSSACCAARTAGLVWREENAEGLLQLSCALAQGLEAQLELGELLAAGASQLSPSSSPRISSILKPCCSRLMAFGAVEHFLFSLSQLRDESVLSLNRGTRRGK